MGCCQNYHPKTAIFTEKKTVISTQMKTSILKILEQNDHLNSDENEHPQNQNDYPCTQQVIFLEKRLS